MARAYRDRDRALACRGWLAACPRRRCLLSALCAAVLTLVASVDGAGAGGQDSGELVALASRDALIVDDTSRLILAVRVPMSLLDEGTTGAWYLPCVRAQLPQAIISALAADDEYRVPTGRKSAPLAAFNKNSCHPSSDKILNLRREPSKLSGGGHQFAAVAHKLFHAIPRGHRLPTIFDASVQRLRSILSTAAPVRGAGASEPDKPILHALVGCRGPVAAGRHRDRGAESRVRALRRCRALPCSCVM